MSPTLQSNSVEASNLKHTWEFQIGDNPDDFEGALGSEFYGKLVTSPYDPEKKLFVLSRTQEQIDTTHADGTYDCKFTEVLEDSSAWNVVVLHTSKDLEQHRKAEVHRIQIRETD